MSTPPPTSHSARKPVPSSASLDSLRIPKRKEHNLKIRPIAIGVCAMAKKAQSGPMSEILNRLRSYHSGGLRNFTVVFFPEEVILNSPVEDWPTCDALIAFFSKGFPMAKAQAYARLRQPLVFNDLVKQELLLNRLSVYRTLESVGVAVPRYVFYDAALADSTTVIDDDDYLQINDVKLRKPLLEKPISGEDHDIYIYYARSQGGGSKRLFRKVGDQSAQYYPDVHTTRMHDGCSYIYEEMLQTEGTDVKVYAVGPEYAHAEARKSPVVDGRVMRNERGKEVRYPVILNTVEKEISRNVVQAFGQTMCGFDILRAEGQSYVCDVNGWSSVKDSTKFWDDAANLLRHECMHALAPLHHARYPFATALSARSPSFGKGARSSRDHLEHLDSLTEEHNEGLGPPAFAADSRRGSTSKQFPFSRSPDDSDVSDDYNDGLEDSRREALGELLCVVAFTRHGDRTPKQKLKFSTSEPSLLALVHDRIANHGAKPTAELKIKHPRDMQVLSDRVEEIVERLTVETKAAEARAAEAAGGAAVVAAAPEAVVAVAKDKEKEKGDKEKDKGDKEKDTGDKKDKGDKKKDKGDSILLKFLAVKQVLRAHPFHGINRKVQLKPTGWDLGGPDGKPTEVQFILKWGGELTSLGEAQSTLLGTSFRTRLYPGEIDGVLRLHATYRHDLKIFSSDEGRVQMTAAAFARGFLDLEGQLTPILASLVSRDATATRMLDETPEEGRSSMNRAKDDIHEMLTSEYRLEDSSLDNREEDSTRGSGSSAEADGGKSADAAPSAAASSSSAVEAATAAVAAVDLTDPPSPPPPPPLAIRAPASPQAAGAVKPSAAVPMPLLTETMPEPVVNPFLHAIHGLDDLMSELPRPSREADAGEAPHRSFGSPREALVALTGLVEDTCEELLGRLRATATVTPLSVPVAVEGAAGDEASSKEHAPQPANTETPLLQYNRWMALLKAFYDKKKGDFDTTKIPDIYDNSVYDMTHNQHLGIRALPELYAVAASLAHYVVPQEYGIGEEEKVMIGAQIGAAMLDKLRSDLLAPMKEENKERVHQLDHLATTDVRTPQRHVRTRFYFTSESHMHSLFNVLRHGGSYHLDANTEGEPGSIFSPEAQDKISETELTYLAHIVFRVYLRPGPSATPSGQASPNTGASPRQDDDGQPVDASRYGVEVLVSPGVDFRQSICDAARRKGGKPRPSKAAARPAFIASSEDLTLDAVDRFIARVLAANEDAQSSGARLPDVSPSPSRKRSPSTSRSVGAWHPPRP